jgi:tripartite ATP-independent transporter DctM subunit
MRDIWAAVPALTMPVAVLGSIIGGIATATEAASISVVYSLLVGAFVYRTLKWQHLIPAIRATVITTGSVMIIMAAATPFGWILTVEQIPHTVASWITDLHAGPFATMAIIVLVLKIMGFWLDLGPALIILAPILVPVARLAGFDPYQIGLIFTMTLGWGLFTPPIGTNIFVVCNVARIDIASVSRQLLPFWVATAIAIALTVLIPGMTQWLPTLFNY